MHQNKTDTLDLLREKIRRMEAPQHTSADWLPTGFTAIDTHLDGGLAQGCVHEVFSAGRDSAFSSRSAAFVAHVLARTTGPVIWASEDYPDLSAPGIRQSGLNPGRLLCVTTRKGGLEALCEDVLNERGVCALVADIRTPLTLTQSRRLVLAASRSHVSGFLLCRTAGAQNDPPASASMTRWRIGGSPSTLRTDLPSLSPVAGAERWAVELLRHRGGPGGTWIITPTRHDPTYSLPVAAPLADRATPETAAIPFTQRTGALRA
ncbi:ImuA family protein [Gluconobacter oxydans]|uniref:ImuA family protein n=1 Tax=Gluconobacter oxydans TaxID=442 RepID=UPI0039E87DCC